MSTRRVLLMVLAVGLGSAPVWAYRSKRPPTFTNLQDVNQLAELNQILAEHWDILNGRYTLENITTDPQDTRKGVKGDLVYATFGSNDHLCVNTSFPAGFDWTCINVGTLSTCPGGGDGMVQFNDVGECGGDAGNLYEKNLNHASIGDSADIDFAYASPSFPFISLGDDAQVLNVLRRAQEINTGESVLLSDLTMEMDSSTDGINGVYAGSFVSRVDLSGTSSGYAIDTGGLAVTTSLLDVNLTGAMDGLSTSEITTLQKAADIDLTGSNSVVKFNNMWLEYLVLDYDATGDQALFDANDFVMDRLRLDFTMNGADSWQVASTIYGRENVFDIDMNGVSSEFSASDFITDVTTVDFDMTGTNSSWNSGSFIGRKVTLTPTLSTFADSSMTGEDLNLTLNSAFDRANDFENSSMIGTTQLVQSSAQHKNSSVDGYVLTVGVAGELRNSSVGGMGISVSSSAVPDGSSDATLRGLSVNASAQPVSGILVEATGVRSFTQYGAGSTTGEVRTARNFWSVGPQDSQNPSADGFIRTAIGYDQDVISGTVVEAAYGMRIAPPASTAPDQASLYFSSGNRDLIVFEGVTFNGNETRISVVDPAQYATVTIPNVTGTTVVRETAIVSGRVVCWNTANTIGYCASAVDASGNCTCN